MEDKITLNLSRLKFHVSRFTFHVSRFTLLVVLLGSGIGCGGKDEPLRQSEALIESGMHPEAINLLEKIIAVEDRNPKARFLLGQAYEGLGSYDQAIRHYRTAINLYVAHPEDKATVRLALAKLYLKQGIRESGYRELRSIVQIHIRQCRSTTSGEACHRCVPGGAVDQRQERQLLTAIFGRTVCSLCSHRIGWITVRFSSWI